MFVIEKTTDHRMRDVYNQLIWQSYPSPAEDLQVVV